MLLSVPPPASTPPPLLSGQRPRLLPRGGGSGDRVGGVTWVREKTLYLITLRRELDANFNTSKSNKHLWEAISLTMCTDKWRNLLKEFKKARSHARSNGGGSGGAGGNGNAKMAYYKEIDDLLKRCGKAGGSGGYVGSGSISGNGAGKSPTSSSKIES